MHKLVIMLEMIWLGAAASVSVRELAAALVAGAGLLWFLVCAVPLCVIDVRVHRLPNRWTLALVIGGTLFLGTATLMAPDESGFSDRLLRMFLGGVLYAGLMMVLYLVTRGGMGMGDVKLALGLGLYTGWLSWDGLLAAVVFGFVVGGLFSLALIVLRRANRHTRVPFGPSMILGACVPLLLLTAA